MNAKDANLQFLSLRSKPLPKLYSCQSELLPRLGQAARRASRARCFSFGVSIAKFAAKPFLIRAHQRKSAAIWVSYRKMLPFFQQPETLRRSGLGYFF